jgi:hypothetical protein
MTAYLGVPVGAHGLEEHRARVVHGPLLRDSLTRQELARRVVAQAQELAAVRRQLVVTQAAARHMEQLRLRMDNESALRTRAQQRLNKVALAFGVLAGLHPELAESIEAAREEIWRSGDA